MGEQIIGTGSKTVPIDHASPAGTYIHEDDVKEKDAEIERLKADLEKHRKYDRCLEDYGMGCERVKSLKVRVAELMAKASQ